MRVKVLNNQHFSTKKNVDLSALGDLSDVCITLPLKKLLFEQKNIQIAKFETDLFISCEEFEDRLICFFMESKTKRISFEAFGSQEQVHHLKKLITRRNQILSYKSPLNKDCSTKVQDSMLTDKNRNLNVKGFIHLAVVFLCLNYVRMILESQTDDKFVFLETVS